MLRSGQLPAARATIAAALSAGGDGDGLLAMAGLLALRSGDPGAAITPLRRLLARRPDDRATRLNLAAAFAETAAWDEVGPLLDPLAGDQAADRLSAFAAQHTGDLASAAARYRTLLTAQPRDVDVWNNLGNVLAQQGAVDDAIAAFERAITLRPEDVRIYLNLAGVLERADRRAARIKVMQDAAARAPDDPEVLLALGLAEAADNRTDAAVATLERAVALAPDAPAPYLDLGLLLEGENALSALADLAGRASARIGPEATLLTAWSAFRAGRHEDASVLADAIPDTVNPVRRFHLQAQIADRLGNGSAAFQLFDQMNQAAVAAAPPPWPGPTYREQVIAATATFRAADQSAPITPGPTPPPIFLAGFPRSGTTLLDTMLGALPDTCVLEERPLLATIEQQLGTGTAVTALGEAAVFELRAHYFALLQTLEPDYSGGRLIDKHPLHTARASLIHRLFPDAPIILVERHPYDAVLSCFMANFQLNHGMRSFVTLEEAARTYDAVFTAWTLAEERLPLRVHRVRYERLVEDVAAELGALLAFLGIDADPATLDHQAAAEARGSVRTASYSQVTEPIYHRALARWRRYAAELAPVLPILKPWALRLGYEVD